MKRLPVLVSFLLFVALCASIAYWTLQFWRPPVRPMAAPAATVANDVPLDAAASLFGGRPAAVGVASNFQLKGVVVADNGRESVAILSTDGKPAQAVGLGTEFMPGVSVREVHSQYILLSESGVVKRVDLPETAKATQADFSPGLPALPTPQMPQMQVAPQMPAQVVNPVPAPMMQPPPQAQQMPPAQNAQPLPPGMQNGAIAVPQPVPLPGSPVPAGGLGGYSQPRRQ